MSFIKSVLSTLAFFAITSPAFAKTDTFKLYRERNHQVNSFCDQYTELKLTTSGSRAIAVLTPKVQGSCEVIPRGKARTYQLSGKDDGCGSTEYRSLNHSDGDENPAPLEITIVHPCKSLT